MRIAWVALVAAGCGRIAFDATPDDATSGNDTLPAQPFTCGGAFSPISVPVSADADLAVGVLTSSLAIGFLDRSVPSSPYLALLDGSHRIAGTPSLLASISGDSLTTLTGWGERLYIEVVTGSSHTVVLTDTGITNARAYDTGTGIAGRDCILEDGNKRERVGVIAEGSILYASYAEATEFGAEVTNDFGVAITSLQCNPGDNHVHGMLATADLACRGARINVPVGSSTPMFDTIGVDAMDCVEPRYAVHDKVLDTGAMVWRASTGGLRTRFLDDTATQPFTVAPSGSHPRIASDGTNIWMVWNDGGQLYVGHTTPNGAVTTRVLDGVAFAGPESYELVRDGDKVHLLALGAAGLSVYTLCN